MLLLDMVTVMCIFTIKTVTGGRCHVADYQSNIVLELVKPMLLQLATVCGKLGTVGKNR